MNSNTLNLKQGLIDATIKGDRPTVTELLSRGADVNAKDDNGQTALMVATYKGEVGLVHLLLEKGADPRIPDRDGWTAFKYAEQLQETAILELLGDADEVKTQVSAAAATELETFTPTARTAVQGRSGAEAVAAKDWRDAVSLGTLIGGSIMILIILLVKPQAPQTAATNSVSSGSSDSATSSNSSSAIRSNSSSTSKTDNAIQSNSAASASNSLSSNNSSTSQSLPKHLTLRGTQNRQIDIYSQPTTRSHSPHYGLDGDRVTAFQQDQGDDGYTWYFVRFPSGADGWVRSDFVRSIDSESKVTKKDVKLPRSAQLKGQVFGSRVNIRSAPSTRSNSPHYGLVGDRVTAFQQAQGDDGYTWYFIEFPSGATGWVRSDFIEIQ
jgi:ankyrin repeat protein